MMMPNPTAGERARQHAAQRLPALRAGPGACRHLVWAWACSASPTTGSCSRPAGPAGSVNAFDAIQARKDHAAGCGHAVPRRQGRRLGPAMPATCGLHPVRLPPGRHDGTDLAGSERERAHRRRRAGASWKVAPSWTPGAATLAYAWARTAATAAPRPRSRRWKRSAPLTTTASGPPARSGAWSRRSALRAQQRQRGRPGLRPSAGFGVFSLNAAAISKQVKLSLGVDNLFDKAYAEHLNLAGDAGFASRPLAGQ